MSLVSGGTTPSGGGGGSVRLQGVGAYDPDGTGGEHDSEAPLATDGNEATSWQTERYDDPPALAGKPGVGLVLQVEGSGGIDQVRMTSETPGFDARIQAGDSPTGPFHDVSSSQTAGAVTTFDLDNVSASYLVVWITTSPPGGSAHVNEVTASS